MINIEVYTPETSIGEPVVTGTVMQLILPNQVIQNTDVFREALVKVAKDKYKQDITVPDAFLKSLEIPFPEIKYLCVFKNSVFLITTSDLFENNLDIRSNLKSDRFYKLINIEVKGVD